MVVYFIFCSLKSVTIFHFVMHSRPPTRVRRTAMSGLALMRTRVTLKLASPKAKPTLMVRNFLQLCTASCFPIFISIKDIWTRSSNLPSSNWKTWFCNVGIPLRAHRRFTACCFSCINLRVAVVIANSKCSISPCSPSHEGPSVQLKASAHVFHLLFVMVSILSFLFWESWLGTCDVESYPEFRILKKLVRSQQGFGSSLA